MSQALSAASIRSPYAALIVFAAGAASSVGPCVAPRFIAVAGLSAGKRRSETARTALAFAAGLVATYAAFGAVSPLLGQAVRLSTFTYWIVAAALAAGGAAALWRDVPACAHSRNESKRNASAGGAFLLGASFALIVSPCCTPLVLGILAYTSAAGSATYASALLAAFALGHALPVFAVAFGVSGMTDILSRRSVRQAAEVISGTLMLGLAAYYALLA